MKIISKVDFTEWVTRVTCSDCGSLLEIDMNDIHSVYRCQKDGDNYQSSCPVCKSNLYVDITSMPKLFKTILDKRLSKETEYNKTRTEFL